MDYNHIIALLDRYWEGETTLEEEALLRRFFSESHPDMPEPLQEAAPLFGFFREEMEREEALGEKLPVPAEAGPVTKVVPLSPFRHWMKYAAVLLMAVGMGYAMKQFRQTATKARIAEVQQKKMEEETRMAYLETKKALQLLAKNLNKGTEKMQKLSYFNEATGIIAGTN
ncbi:hypothetical protein HF324_07700 [Chitinophaga oryzae]|uniref:Uncharacterized protein n=1 Tax=Chitinophaga oryzae TaxID=2725414 RepID=A0AAE6ZE31_9BACT|nr:hypothetical protein [Chitinophaga oryzae]QJB31252.1 hypothetical protein HF329_08035 [Chitinophaga oryzae]QJB37740.1 hypothetical protein HF324_07700 [Chitinophaga oryzae]